MEPFENLDAVFGFAKRVPTEPNDPQLPPFAPLCHDCHSALDIWGICPNADPKDVARMRAPVHCGKTLTEVTHELHALLSPAKDEEAAA